MNIHNDNVIDILNELLADELRSLLARLRESTVRVDWGSANESQAVDSMIDEEMEHRAWLADALHDVGGDPAPVTADIGSSNVHYLKLSYVMPQVVEERRRSLGHFESAAAQLTGNDRASSVVTKIIERKRRHVEHLTQLTEQARHQPV